MLRASEMKIHVAVLDCHIPSVSWLKSVLVEQYVWTSSPSSCSHGLEIASILASSRPGCESLSRDHVQLHSHAIVSKNGAMESKHVLQALQQIQRDGRVRIVNLSWGDDLFDDSAVHDMMRNMSEQQGIVFVAAAGNSGPGAETITAPAHLPFVIAVGALELASPKLRLLFQSSQGPPPARAQVGKIVKPDCVALVPRVMSWDNQCVQRSGTSYAAPHVVSMLVGAMHECNLRGLRLNTGAWLQVVHAAGQPMQELLGWQQGSGAVTHERIMQAALDHSPHVSVWPPHISLNSTVRDVVAIHSFAPHQCANTSDAKRFAQIAQVSPLAPMHQMRNSTWMSMHIPSACGVGVLQARRVASADQAEVAQSQAHTTLWVCSVLICVLVLVRARTLRSRHQQRNE